MEVHHHSHTSRKKWTHYFWEFLMLFFAVFCGFLAEYQLEHQIEKDREKQYMQSMMQDLQSDTAEIRFSFNLVESQLLLLDSVLDLVNNQSLSKENIARLYMLGTNSGRVVQVRFENRTSSQLKNSGGMRLVRKKRIADSILRYWKNLERCEQVNERLEEVTMDRVNIAVELFHNKYYILGSDEPLAPVVGVKEEAQLINNDPRLLSEYSNRSYNRRGILRVYRRNLIIQKDQAIRLIDQIREAYHLEK